MTVGVQKSLIPKFLPIVSRESEVAGFCNYEDDVKMLSTLLISVDRL